MKALISSTVSIFMVVHGFSQTFNLDRSNITEEIHSGDLKTQIIRLTNTTGSSLTIDLKTASPAAVTFMKSDSADWTLGENQDTISDAVIITRQHARGIFNVAMEDSFTDQSPVGTEWAFGKTADLSLEDYAPWREAVSAEPTQMLGQDMSLHLISEDLYFDVQWHTWTCCGNGGGFSYTRRRINHWLAFAEPVIELSANETMDIIVELSAGNLGEGTYTDQLIFTNASDAGETIALDVTMEVSDAAGIYTPVTALDFEEKFVNGEYVEKLAIKNVGSLDLLITEIQVDNSAYTITPMAVGIDPGQSEVFTITFSPTEVTDYEAEMSFTSNDPSDPVFTVEVKGRGVEPPIVMVTPASISGDLDSGDEEVRSITISNTGNSSLHYQLIAEEVSSPGDSPVFHLLDTDPDEADTDFDVENIYSAQTSEFIYLKLENYDPYQANETLVAELVIALDTDQNMDTGLDAEQLYDWDLGIDHAIVYDFEESFQLLKYNEEEEDFEEVGPVASVIEPTTGEVTLIIDRTFIGDKFNFAILIADGEIDQIPDAGNGNIEFQFFPTWLDLDIREGTITAGNQEVLSVGLDASGLIEGEYIADLILESNDPVTSEISIDITLRVTGFATYMGPPSLDFDELYQNITSSAVLELENTGTAALQLEEIVAGTSEVSLSASSLTLSPGETGRITVEVTAGSVGDLSTDIHFSTNDAQSPNVTIPITATVVAPPVITLSTDEINASVVTGKSMTEQFTISNTGGSRLEYQVNATSAYALDLNQEFQAVEFQHTDLMGDMDEITVSMWLYLEEAIDCDGENNWRSLLSKSLAFVSGTGFDVVVEENGSLTWSLGTEDGILRYGTTYELPVGQWAFVSFTYNGSEAKIFIDGQEVSGEMDNPSAGGKILSNSYLLQLSSYAQSCQFGAGLFPGVVAELRMWDVARSATDIEADMNRTLTGQEAGLSGYWTFSEGTGDISADLTGNEFTANIYDASLWAMGSPLTWLKVEMQEGTLETNEEKTVELTFDGADLAIGSYDAEITIRSNDPHKPEVSLPIQLEVDIATGLPEAEQVEFRTYPNPFQEELTISYHLAQRSFIDIAIFDMAGRQVHRLVKGTQPMGYHELTVGPAFSSGIQPHSMYYLVMWKDGDRIAQKRIIKGDR